MRVMSIILALIALFIFPWQVALIAVFGASLLTPLSGIALGIIADLVYYVPGAAFLPYFSLFGLAATVIGFLVQRFVKTRIIGE